MATKEPRQGKKLKVMLQSRGIEPNTVTKPHGSNIYRVEFFNDSAAGTAPAIQWADRIRAAFREHTVKVHRTDQTVASWRPQPVVIHAIVELDGLPEKKPEPHPDRHVEIENGEVMTVVWGDHKTVVYRRDDPFMFEFIYRMLLADTRSIYGEDTFWRYENRQRVEVWSQLFDYTYGPDEDNDPRPRPGVNKTPIQHEDDDEPEYDPFFKIDWFGDGKGGD